MNTDLIQERLKAYNIQTKQEEDNALKEIMQEIALLSLSRSGFFQHAAFQSGTCLRIFYNLNRFSEDLDFVLKKLDDNFKWTPYLKEIKEEFSAYGFDMDIKDRSENIGVIKKAFIKNNSVGNVLTLKHQSGIYKSLTIKLEIDTNPPENSTYEVKYLNFPLTFAVSTQDLPSLFASKSHALLCRNYVKGRDWYDFIWYASRKTTINFNLLSRAIDQAGPWAEQNIIIDKTWYFENMKNKIESINWDLAKEDVIRFLKARDQISLEVWSRDFFLNLLNTLCSF
jgi:predicted nucleotidyltransferase component of viral defense system